MPRGLGACAPDKPEGVHVPLLVSSGSGRVQGTESRRAAPNSPTTPSHIRQLSAGSPDTGTGQRRSKSSKTCLSTLLTHGHTVKIHNIQHARTGHVHTHTCAAVPCPLQMCRDARREFRGICEAGRGSPELQPSPEHSPPLPCSHTHFSYKQASRARRREHRPRAWGGVRRVRKPMGAPCSCQAQSGWGGLLRLGPGGSGPITEAEPSVGPRLSVL